MWSFECKFAPFGNFGGEEFVVFRDVNSLHRKTLFDGIVLWFNARSQGLQVISHYCTRFVCSVWNPNASKREGSGKIWVSLAGSVLTSLSQIGKFLLRSLKGRLVSTCCVSIYDTRTCVHILLQRRDWCLCRTCHLWISRNFSSTVYSSCYSSSDFQRKWSSLHHAPKVLSLSHS